MRVYEKVRTYMANNDLKTANVAKKAGISAKSFDAIDFLHINEYFLCTLYKSILADYM